ncbi:AraC family transcriptional regulator [Cellulosilyticum ruminicola]|uniref:AraC family transcriptional regulator n=1 Tax=Cellulosilyticum ruminicola TaxID=425254 RepID=UPI0006D2BED8|nr:AraC family transcriptional regulator [Cellulosilyticum ruminicola]
MQIEYIGHNYTHNMDFKITRPNGSNNYLALIIKSPATFYIDGQPIHTSPNTFFLYKKGSPQYYEAYEQPFSNDWFHFNLAPNEIHYLEQLNIPFETPIQLIDVSFFSLLIKQMAYEVYSDNLYKSITLDRYFQIFFIKLAESYNAAHSNELIPRYQQLDLLRSKIYNFPYKKWTVEWLAHEITLSPCYFQKLYKKRFGITCANDIINARIELAKYNLTTTDLSIKNIAELCGYANDVHFMRQFKKITNLTPSEYRLQHMQKIEFTS